MVFPNRGGIAVFIFAQHIPAALGQKRALAQKLIAAPAERLAGRPGHCEDVPALVRGPAGRDQRAAALLCLDDHDAVGQGADDAVARREVPGVRRRAGRVFREQAALLRNAQKERTVFLRIDDVHPAAQDAEHRAAAVQRAVRGSRIDAAGHAGDDDGAAAGDLPAETQGRLAAPVIGRAGADQTDAGLLFQIGQPPDAVEHRRRIHGHAQTRGIVRLAEVEDADPALPAAGANLLRAAEVFTGQDFAEPVAKPFAAQRRSVRRVDRLGRTEASEQSFRVHRAETGQLGEPDPMLRHSGHDFLICHRTTAAATAAFRDSQQEDIGMIVSRSAAPRNRAPTP